MNLLPGLLDELRRNVRFSLRTLRKNPGFAITAMVTLALATGASTAMFGVISAISLRPLPYRDPAKLVWITQILKGNSTDELTITPDFLDWRRLNHSFLYLAAFNPGLRNLTGLAEPMQISAAKASADLLPALGIQPAKGRNFRREEDQKGKDHVAILSHALWQRSFGGDPAWIGRSITLDGESFEVVGVLPRSFVFPDEDKVDLITPLGKNEAAELQRGNSVSIVRNIVGRLRPEVTADAAKAELTAIQAALPTFLPWKPKISIRMVPLQKHLLGEVERAAWTLLAATLLLLLIACANVANLLLAQAARREREIAVRIAVGGSRRSLLAQLLTESLTLAVLASLGGLAIALWSRRLLLTLTPERLPSVDALPIDANVLGFSIAIAVITTLIFGTIPALRLTQVELSETLKEGGAAKTSSAVTGRFLSGLAVAEIALSLVLLIGAGLLLESFYRLRFANLGFHSGGLVVATLKPDPARFPTPERQVMFLQQLLETLRSLPGVEAAALTDSGELPPGGGHATNTFRVEGMPVPPQGQRPVARRQLVSSEYFGLMGIPLRRGRLFGPQDGIGTPRVAIINEALQRCVFEGRDPIGWRLQGVAGDPAASDRWTIVGVVGDVKTSGLSAPPEPAIYYSYLQSGRGLDGVGLVIHTAMAAGAVAAEMRRRIAQLAPSQPVTAVQTMEQRLTESVARPRFVAALLAAFAGLALALGLIGVYGVLGCCVRWRWREMAIRHALGAQPGQLRWLLLRQGLSIVVTGIVLGVAGAAGATRLLRGFLHEIDPIDPVTFAAASLAIAATAVVACWLPARRAGSVDPATVLRAE